MVNSITIRYCEQYDISCRYHHIDLLYNITTTLDEFIQLSIFCLMLKPGHSKIVYMCIEYHMSESI